MKVIFDLDNTLFFTNDKYGNHIWAKQMVQPFIHNEDEQGEYVTDDVGSVCRLRDGAKQFLTSLKSAGTDVGFLSNGRALCLRDDQQPSLVLLKIFELYDEFDLCRILQYKTASKVDALQNLYDTHDYVFFDDNNDVIASLREAGITVIDAKKDLSLKAIQLHD